MNFYKAEYWEMMNSSDKKTREKGDYLWDKSMKKYAEHFKSIKNQLPKKFMKEYLLAEEFHDYKISGIRVTNKKGKYYADIDFLLSSQEQTYKVIFKQSVQFKFDVPTTKSWLAGELTWGYTEFYLHADGLYFIKILCDLCCEFDIMCKNIIVEKCNKRCNKGQKGQKGTYLFCQHLINQLFHRRHRREK